MCRGIFSGEKKLLMLPNARKTSLGEHLTLLIEELFGLLKLKCSLIQ